MCLTFLFVAVHQLSNTEVGNINRVTLTIPLFRYLSFPYTFTHVGLDKRIKLHVCDKSFIFFENFAMLNCVVHGLF